MSLFDRMTVVVQHRRDRLSPWETIAAFDSRVEADEWASVRVRAARAAGVSSVFRVADVAALKGSAGR